jgi:hypothetical protein
MLVHRIDNLRLEKLGEQRSRTCDHRRDCKRVPASQGHEMIVVVCISRVKPASVQVDS